MAGIHPEVDADLDGFVKLCLGVGLDLGDGGGERHDGVALASEVAGAL
jgi:hypothetical protein